MANFAAVNKSLKAAYPMLDIEAVRGQGYVYFDGKDGFDKVGSICVHPTSTSTSDMTRFAVEEVELYFTGDLRC
jgi:hypothetical protein